MTHPSRVGRLIGRARRRARRRSLEEDLSLFIQEGGVGGPPAIAIEDNNGCDGHGDGCADANPDLAPHRSHPYLASGSGSPKRYFSSSVFFSFYLRRNQSRDNLTEICATLTVDVES